MTAEDIITVRVIAQSQEHLDQIYLALNKIDGVKFIL